MGLTAPAHETPAHGTPARAAGPDDVVLVVPGDVDAPTGGNVWDRRVAAALSPGAGPPGLVRVPGGWPDPSAADLARLDRALAAQPDGTAVLLDGLLGAPSPDVVRAHTGRLRLGLVLHLPLALETGLDPATAAARDRAERRSLAAVDVVVVTSRWLADRIGDRGLRRAPVVAAPGTDPATLRPPGSPAGARLLCLAAVTPRKGQRLLVRALQRLGTAPDGTEAGVRVEPGVEPGPAAGWTLRLVGPQPDPAELAAVRAEVAAAGLADRVTLTGPLVGHALEEQWRRADLLVVPSCVETFGMVVTEAVARGRPVLATTGSALPEALGATPAGPPGLLVPPGDPDALARALDRWWDDAGLRADLRGRARLRAGTLAGWDRTATAVRQAFA